MGIKGVENEEREKGRERERGFCETVQTLEPLYTRSNSSKLSNLVMEKNSVTNSSKLSNFVMEKFCYTQF